MRRSLPPLNPLRIFEAAARHVNFTSAAAELGVTQAAVSRQIAVLEGALGACLFDRQQTRLRLTRTGAQYLTSIRPAFDLIDGATAEVQGRQGVPRLRLRTSNSFATYWLIPRLSRFTEQYPDIEIEISTSNEPVQFDHDDIDVAIQLTDILPTDASSDLLFHDALVPVCSPALAARISPRLIADLSRTRLLHTRLRCRDWSDWASFVGADMESVGGLYFESSSLSYDAAKAGMGVAMGELHLLDEELQRGSLVVLFDRVLQRQSGYYLVHPRRVRANPSVCAFRQWLGDEIRQMRACPTAAPKMKAAMDMFATGFPMRNDSRPAP